MSELQITNAKNISEGGILITSSEYLEPSTILKLAINLPTREKPVEAYAKVSRCSQDEKTGLYNTGICFVDISKSDREEIATHLELVH